MSQNTQIEQATKSTTSAEPVLGAKWMASAQVQLAEAAAENPAQFRLVLSGLAKEAPTVDWATEEVRMFWRTIEAELVWDFIPFTFAYSLYGAMALERGRGTRVVGRCHFLELLVELLESDPRSRFTCPDRTQLVYGEVGLSRAMRKDEPLVFEYQLENWMTGRGRQRYRGMHRRPGKRGRRG